MTEEKKDLIVIVACANLKAEIIGLLNRFRELGLRDITYDVFVHSERDSGCFSHPNEILKGLRRKYDRCIIIFDREGCGHDDWRVKKIENNVKRRVESNGWNNRVKVVVIDPELEMWVWGNISLIEELAQWDKTNSLQQWLIDHRHLGVDNTKPNRPKETFEAVLEVSRFRRTSDLYAKHASKANFQRCQDRSFNKFKETLQEWFGS